MTKKCKKCGKPVEGDAKICSKCWDKVMIKAGSKKKPVSKILFIVLAVLALVVIAGWYVLFKMTVPITMIEVYQEKVAYEETETYYVTEYVEEQISGGVFYIDGDWACPSEPGCTCILFKYGLVGPCSKCRCTETYTEDKKVRVPKTRIVTKYRNETKYRTVEKEVTLIEKMNMQEVNGVYH